MRGQGRCFKTMSRHAWMPVKILLIEWGNFLRSLQEQNSSVYEKRVNQSRSEGIRLGREHRHFYPSVRQKHKMETDDIS